jgi:acyl carrier protein
VARFVGGGLVEFKGRADGQVKVRGYRVEVGEVEAAVSKHPAVRDVVVVVTGDHSHDKRLVAYVVGEPGQPAVGVTQLQRYVKEKLPEYMVPQVFVLLDELPLNANGKVDRNALPAPEHARLELEGHVAPRTPIEEVIAGIWGDVLKVERVGVNDNFFDLGGHSLLATQVVSRMREAFGAEVSLRELFEQPTLGELARRVEESRRTVGAGVGMTAPPIVSVKRDEGAVLSYAQQRLWFLDQLEPGSPLYNCPGAAHLRGRLDVEALERSLNDIIARHESLRTKFASVEGQPVQVITPLWTLRLDVEELSRLDKEGQAAEVERRARAEARQGFDLSRGPLLRVKLLRLGEEEHVVFFTMHHIISDAWSLGVFLHELAALYEAHRGGVKAELPELTIQYADYAVWQREWLRGEVLEQQLEYWRKQLDGAPSVLELPFARPRPSEQSHRGGQEAIELSAGIAEQLRALARREGATLYMALLAAFNALLYYYTRSEDIVVGTNAANRGRRETDHLIGFFVNQLAIRTNLSGDPTFGQLLQRVREVTIDAYAHQDVPFDRLVEALKLERNLSRSPLFQLKIDLLSMPLPDIGGSELAVTPLKADTGGSHLDVIFSLVDTQRELTGVLLYNTDLFDAPAVLGMFKQLESLLEQIVARPDASLSSLAESLAEAERQQAKGREELFRQSQSQKLKNLRRSNARR